MKNLSSFLTASSCLWVVLGLITGAARAQAPVPAPSWDMAMPVGPSTGSMVTATVADDNGNVYLAGVSDGTATFGSISLPATSVCGFVTKWNSRAGRYEWAKPTYSLRPAVIAVQGNSVYVAGMSRNYYTTPGAILTLDNLTLPLTYLNPIIGKLTDAGSSATWSWAEQLPVEISSLAAAGSSVYVGGTAGGPFTLGNVTINGSTTASSAYVAKLTDSGSSARWTWGQTVGSSIGVGVQGLAVSGGNVYVSGILRGSSAQFGSITLTGPGTTWSASSGFVAKLVDGGSSAAWSWATIPDMNSTDGSVHHIAVQGASVYVEGVANRISYIQGHYGTPFVAKLTDAGPTATLTWMQQAQGLDADSTRALVVKGRNVYMAGTLGYYQGPLTFGATSLLGIGGLNAYVAKIEDNGPTASFVWAKRAGAVEMNMAASLAVTDGKVYLGGRVSSPVVTFDAYTVTSSLQNSYVHFAGFLASLDDAAALGTRSSAALTGLSLAPNPTQGRTLVQVPGVAGVREVSFTILDALGRRVLQQSAALPAVGLRQELDLTGLPAGLYLVQVTAGNASSTCRLAVE